jgi:hypothetical protein
LRLAGIYKVDVDAAKAAVVASRCPLTTCANVREGTEKPEYVKKPQYYNDHNDGVQDGLNRSLHGDEAIDQPK